MSSVNNFACAKAINLSFLHKQAGELYPPVTATADTAEGHISRLQRAGSTFQRLKGIQVKLKNATTELFFEQEKNKTLEA